jgi:ATP-binding cassette, subfamily F, member 3
MLAKLLLRSPELLLLDEPTNHLDIESIQWLEMYLKQYKGAIIMVSHDRAFLDSVTNRTIEIAHNGVFDMPVNYTKFIELRKREKELQQAAYENQQKEIKTKERFIERFKAKATKASQAQSRVKQLEKIERIKPEEELKAKIKFKFPEAPRSGKVAVEAKNIGKSFEEKHVFSNFDFIIARGERIAFVGKNGEGKTTLARIIAGELEHEGALKIGYNVHTGFYAQHRNESLDPKLNVFETIDLETTPDTQTNVRSILGAFLFSNDDVYKKVSVLSGGEKARLSLAKLLLKPVNLLILDEPTNHLDMQSKEILKDALKDFSGTLIVVSHDRDFLKGLTDKVFEISNGKIYEYAGDVYEFIQKKQIEQLDQLNFEKQKSKTAEIKKADKAETSKLSYTERKESKKALKKLEKDVKQFENKIASKETEIEVLEKEMQSNEFSKMVSTDQQVYFDKYSKLKEELLELMDKWTKAGEKLENQKKSTEH